MNICALEETGFNIFLEKFVIYWNYICKQIYDINGGKEIN